MRIIDLKKSAALLGATALVALAGPASAAPPYNITVGVNTTGVHPFSALTKGPIKFIAAGPLGAAAMDCAGSGVPAGSGTVTAGANATGLNIARFTNSTWTAPCTGPGGLSLNVTHFAGSSWQLNATGTATNALTDNVAGYINNIDARVTSNPAGACSFRVTGRANAIFHETPKPGTTVQELEVNDPGNLVISGVSGCLGFVANGNSATFTGDYNITSPDGYINIKP